MLKKLLAIATVASFVLFSSCNDDDDNPVPSNPGTGTLTTHFDLKWDPMNNVDFNPGDTFTTASGDVLIVGEVRMWISNIKLYNGGTLKWTDEESYYLVEKTASNEREMIMLDVPVGDYDEIEFSVGVDSARNHSLDQKAGELDENIGMSWNWNTGYKFYVHNGQYFDTDSNSYQTLRMHIGLDDYFVTKKMSLPNTLSVEKGGSHMVHFMTANGRTYSSPNTIDVGAAKGDLQSFFTATVYDQIVENYSSMFMIHHVE